MGERKYSASVNYETKLKTVMERLGIEKFDYDWSRRDCYVECRYHGKSYRFENSFDKAAAAGRKVSYVGDLFAEVVLSLEGLARATEKGIFTLDMLFSGVPSLPEKRVVIPECFTYFGFEEYPSTEELKKAYHDMAKVLHPDVPFTGQVDAFAELQRRYETCLAYLNGELM